LHVVFFNRSYHPDPEATGQYLTELAEDLVAQGLKVSVVCGRSYHVRGKWGFRFLRVQRLNGVRVIRVFNTQLAKSSFLLRLTNLGTYFAGCLAALFFLPIPDVVVSLTDPPLLPLLAGAYACLVRAPFVFLINDLYPDIGVELGQISNPVWVKLLGLATSFGLRRAERVIVLGEDMKEKVLKKGCRAQKIALLPYWADTQRIRPCKERNPFRAEHDLKPSDFIVMYSGNLGLSQNLEDVLRVAGAFKNCENVHFVIVGEGARKDSLRHLCSELGLNGRVLFLPYQPRERLAQSLSAANLHLVPLAGGVAGSIVPSKTYGIMASGTPFVAIMDREAETARIAERYQCGLWCRPNSPDELKERIEFARAHPALMSAMGRNGRRAAEREYSRHRGTGRYCKLLKALPLLRRQHRKICGS